MLKPTMVTTSCDVFNCSNLANFTFDVKGKNRQMFICKECAIQLMKDTNQLTTPKSPANAIKTTVTKHTLREKDNGNEK